MARVARARGVGLCVGCVWRCRWVHMTFVSCSYMNDGGVVVVVVSYVARRRQDCIREVK